MPERRVIACLIIDDTPINASYWWRLQQTEMGFDPPELAFGHPWRDQADAALISVELFEALADFAYEFQVRGKLTLLPWPAGLGRLDRKIRGYTKQQHKAILDLYRHRLAAHFDITPEVLTHTMAINTKTGELLPHSETAWLSALARSNDIGSLVGYFADAYVILTNAGFVPHGMTVGGMNDPSGIAADEMLIHGHHLEPLSRALWATERDHHNFPKPDATFVFAGAPPTTQRCRETGLPEVTLDFPGDGQVWSVYADPPEDPLAPLFGGVGDVAAVTDALVGPDLESGTWIEAAEAGRAVVINVHGQTLNSRNTHLGLTALTEAVRRLTERYGHQLHWCTTRELCKRSEYLSRTSAST